MSHPPIREAATLVLLRQGAEGLETLLLRRSDKVDFASGAWVFPGGRVDAGDAEAAGQDPQRAACLAAVRETREESALTVDPDSLRYFAHWTTPLGAPRRYATWFFIAPLEQHDPVIVDGSEIAAHRWMSPAAALEAHRRGELPVMPPTWITLAQLAPAATVAEAMAFFTQRAPESYQPRAVIDGEEVCFLYEGDAGYASGDVTAPGPRHRFRMGKESRFEKSGLG